MFSQWFLKGKGIILPFSAFTMITAAIVYLHGGHRKRFLHLISNKLFVFSTFIVGLWSFYILTSTHHDDDFHKMQKATKTALIGFIIAVMGYLELVVAPFWILWLVSYYFNIQA